MTTILLTIIVLGLSYLINRLMLQLFKEHAVTYGAPIFEEILKTVPAYLLNRPVFYVHVLFGLAEAVFDYFTGSRKTGKWAALASILSHTVFGGVTLLMLSVFENITAGVLTGIAVHMIWNWFIMRFDWRFR